MSYVMEKSFSKDGKIDRAKFKRWCVTHSIPIPRALLECEKQTWLVISYYKKYYKYDMANLS